MEKIYINFKGEPSEFINDVKDNFEYLKAFKYLKAFSQGNRRFYDLFNNINKVSGIDSEELESIENYYIEEISANGYSQSERQDWILFFNKDIQKDEDAMEELKYFLQDLQYYFTCEDIYFSGYIEHIKIVDNKEYIYKEELDSICRTYLEESIEKEHVKEYIKDNGLDLNKYDLIYNIENIIY